MTRSSGHPIEENSPAETHAACTDKQHVAAAGSASSQSRTWWQKLTLVIKVVEVRLRFVAILAIVALCVGYWDTIRNHWEKHTSADGAVFELVRTVAGDRAALTLWPHAAAVARLDPTSEYYCPMHPSVVRSDLDPTSEIPKCPICGMPLARRVKGLVPRLPEGVLSRKQLSPEQIQLAGIRTVAVTSLPLTKELRSVGYVGFDESRRSRIVSRSAGYLEKLFVARPWMPVEQGDPLGEIYSPEIYSTVRELLLGAARDPKGEFAKSGREKLRLLGISDSEIDEIIKSGRANHRLVLRSPISGHVVRKEVLEGAYVEAGQTLFEVADLSRVWIEAEVYQADIAFLHEGQAVEASVDGRSEIFGGSVTLVHPHLDPLTRTNTIRFEVDNPNHVLRPGMFATVRIKRPLSELEPFQTLARLAPQKPGEVIAVPEQSVIDSGTRKVVYVEHAPGLFQGVEVEVGPRIDGYYPVIAGLKAGDRVAERGAFLIDAETRLNPAAAANYLGSTAKLPHGQHTGVERPGTSAGTADNLSASAQARLEAIGQELNKLEPAERTLATAQRICPVSNEPLGSMGLPHRITIKGKTVFLCCSGCELEANNDPEKYLKKATELATPEKREH